MRPTNPSGLFTFYLHTLYILLIFLCFTGCGLPEDSKPTVRNGVLDLRGYPWNNGLLDLSGQWQFSSGEFLDPWEKAGHLVSVPGFLGAKDLGGTQDSKGFGTYTVEIFLPEGSPALAIRLPIIGTASEVFINGDLAATQGKIGTTPETTLPAYQPLVLEVPEGRGSQIFLSIRVANFEDLFTGIGFPLTLGPTREVHSQRERAVEWESLLFGALFFMGLYHFGYFIFRPRDKTPLWFGIFCISIALRSTLYSEVLFLDWFPGTSWYFVLRGVYLAMVIPAGAFLLFVQDLYPRQAILLVPRLLLPVIGAFGLLVLFAPVPVFTAFLVPYQFFLGLLGIYSLAVVFRAMVTKQTGARIFLLGTGLFLLSIFLDIFKSHAVSGLPSLIPWGSLVFLMLQGLVLTRRFSQSFTLSEEFSANLSRLNDSLERFIPKEVLGFLEKESIVEINLGDYSEQRMTVFFLDIRDFTALSETLSPKDNFRFINSFLGRFGPLIRGHGGFVDKYLGDGLMALFPGDPDDAVLAALDMRNSLEEYNKGRIRSGYVPIRFGIGIHTGQLMLGTIGENRRMDSTVISDTVNAASRLEGLTKKFKTDILVSGETVLGIKGRQSFRFTFLGEETVKGKTRAIDVYLVDTDSLTASPGEPESL